MAIRSTDEQPPIIHVAREIPLWQLMVAAATLAFTAVTSYVKLDTLGADMKKVLSAQDDTKEKLRDLQFEFRELRSRVVILETKKESP